MVVQQKVKPTLAETESSFMKDLIESCCEYDENKRPSFQQICEGLESYTEQTVANLEEPFVNSTIENEKVDNNQFTNEKVDNKFANVEVNN